MAIGKQQATLTGADQGTNALAVGRLGFNLSISGTFVATIHLQRSFDNGVTWLDVETFTAPIERVGDAPENMEIRLFIKSGNYTSGSAVCRLSF